MDQLEKIKLGLKCCAEGNNCAKHCPYDDDNDDCKDCTSALARDALEYIEGYPSKWNPPDQKPEIPDRGGIPGISVLVCTPNNQVFPLWYMRRKVRGKTVERWQWDTERVYYGEIAGWMYYPKAPIRSESDEEKKE